MCLYPRLIKNRKYTANKKNGGNIPAISDDRVKYVPIGCQNCIECRRQKANEWRARMLEDIKINTNGKFVVLTFSNESIKNLSNEIKYEGYELDNQIATIGVRRFCERWRKKYKKSVRHWFVTELGHKNTENIHLHGIIWTNEHIDRIREIWQYGYIWPRPKTTKKTYVNAESINYFVKYVSKIDNIHQQYKPIILTSPGIGNNYTNRHDSKRNKYNNNKTIETYRTSTGHEIALPTYWRNKIYTEEEREKLWLQKLDKEERWICGEMVSIKETDKEYWELLKWHRLRNKQLGYGTDEKNWNREVYERETRIIKQKARIKNASGGV